MHRAPTPDTRRASPADREPTRPAGRSGLAALGLRLARHRVLVLVVTGILVALAVPFGVGVEERLSVGGTTASKSEAAEAEELLKTGFAGGTPNVVFVVDAPRPVDDPEVAGQGRELTTRLGAEPEVLQAVSYWSLGDAPPLRSDDARSALVMVSLAGDDDAVRKAAERIVPTVVGQQGDLTVRATGPTQVQHEIDEQSQRDLVKAELIAAPLSLLILLLVFGSAVAAAIPLVVGVLAVLGSFVVLRLLDLTIPVSVFAVNVSTALGLGLAIDYSLFVITRFREELARGKEVPAAIAQTTRTAGRTVVFSAITVALSLSAMLVFPMFTTRSYAYSGIAVVLLAAIGSVVVLPALLAVLGHRINALPVRLTRRPRTADPAAAAPGFWHRLATTVMRRPVLFTVAVAAFLLFLGTPFLRAEFGHSDDRILPAQAPSHVAAKQIRDDFPSQEDTPTSVVLPGLDAGARAADVRSYAARLSELSAVTRVDAPTGSYAGGQLVAPPGPATQRLSAPAGSALQVVSDTDPYSNEGADLVTAVRGVPAPGPALVGGEAASILDSKRAVSDRMPWALAIVALSTLVLLFLFTGSVLIPVKAVVLNLFSLTATFGAMVWIFQEGHLRGLVGDFTVTGFLDMDTPILMFCIAFGVSMDYEVFLLSRIKEEYERTGDNTAAVVWGIERTGRLVTSAAALVAVVLLAFATSGLTVLKLLGVGLALAVIMDASLVRGILVPGIMRLAGRANWWAPRPLRRLHERIGLAD